MQPECLILDCDGVVIDSEVIAAELLIKMLAPHGVNIDNAHVQQHFLGTSFASVKAKIKADFAVELPASFEQHYRAQLIAEFGQRLQPTAGVADVLKRIKIPFCLATSSTMTRTTGALSAVGLLPMFDGRIFTAEQVVHGKPAPDLFLFAAEQMSVNAERCLVIEDSFFGVTAALKANMAALHYRGGKHLTNTPNSVTEHYPQVAVLDHWAQLEQLYPSIVSPN